ncbi:MAG: DUF4837 family protein [Flavobacterium sp.]|nr:MAG: DUF4837 family protein [Flavobacterium sp.]
MKKALFLCLLSCIVLSCKKSTDGKLASASGKINNISVIIDDQLWNGEIGDSIRNKFASPITGLPQEEPLFTINQYPVKLLEGFMTNSRNIVVVKKEQNTMYKVVSDEYAKPQNVFHISGRTVPEIIEIIEKNAPAIIRKMHQTEILEMQKRIDTALISNKPVAKKFGITIDIPKGYKLVMQREKFMWFKKEMISGNMSLLVYSAPGKCLQKNNDAIRNIVNMRDSIGNLYIRGTGPDSQMKTEQSYAPYLSHRTLSGRRTFETRGTWELQNDYMSGPYINYAIMDKPNKRILVLEGFCYAPSKEKRDLMHELEAIIESVKIVNPPQTKKH